MIATTVAAVAAIAPAQVSDDRVAREFAGRVAGKPVDCVNLSLLGGGDVVDDRTIVYRQSGHRIWRNDLPEQCRGLHLLSTLIVDVYGSQLCRNDSFRAVEPGSSIPTANCRFGSFTPYDRP